MPKKEPSAGGKKGGKNRDEEEDEIVESKKASTSKKHQEEPAPSKGKGKKHVEEVLSEEDARPKKGKGGRRGDSDEEDMPVKPKAGAKGKKRDDDDEEEPAPSKGKAPAKSKKGGDSDDEDDDAPKGAGKDESSGTGALSKTALKKAKRDAKKNKGGAGAPATAGGAKGGRAHDDDDAEEEQDAEENEDAMEEEEEAPARGGFDFSAEREVLEKLEALGLSGTEDEDGGEDSNARRAEKKKKRKEDEKKRLAKAKHGIVEEPPHMPTPPPQPLPDEDDDYLNEEALRGADMTPAAEEEEQEEGVESKKDKKKKKKKDKERDGEEEEEDSTSKKEKKSKKSSSKSKDEEEDEEDVSSKSKSKKSSSKETTGEEEEAEEDDEDEAPGSDKEGDHAVAATTKKKKLSNKEKRRMRDELEKREEELQAAAMAKPPDNSVFAVSATSVDTSSEAWKNSRDVVVPSFSITAKGKTLFKDAELRIAHGRRYGLIGPNGKGKSVLLRAIASGDMPIPPAIDTLYVEQEVVPSDELAVNVVLSADKRRTFLLERERVILALADDPNKELSDALHEELKSVSEELRATKAESAEAKALNLLQGLGFSDEMCRMPTRMLSGGWRMRVSIAKGLFMEPTLLLLDEPTNHLDLEAVIFLESVLSKWEKTLVVVSHDQDFLDEVCQEIISLDTEELRYYKGNYTSFEEQFELEMEQRKKDYEKDLKRQQEEKKSKNRLTAKERENEMKRKQREMSKTDKGRKNEELAIAAAGKNRGEKNAESASAAQRPKDYIVKFSFPPATELSPPIIQVRDVHFRYGDTAPWLFRNLSFGIDMKSRICVCGPNGAGKSTLIKLITGDVHPVEGDVSVNPKLRLACYKQHFVDILPLGKTPVEYLHDKFSKDGVTQQDVRGRLGRYGLPGEAHTIKMASLSGGQKARVVFAHMSYENPHILIMDEPSNNLDMQSIRALGDAINEFDGGVVLVSHDTRLIEETDMTLWVVEKQRVFEQDGGIEEYREEILEKIEKRETAQKALLEEKEARRRTEREAKLKEIQERQERKRAAGQKQ